MVQPQPPLPSLQQTWLQQTLEQKSPAQPPQQTSALAYWSQSEGSGRAAAAAVAADVAAAYGAAGVAGAGTAADGSSVA